MITWPDLFATTNAKRWLKRYRGPKPGEILPDAWSFDDQYLLYTEALTSTLNDLFPPDFAGGGLVGPSGIAGDFNRLLNVTGYGMNPFHIPMMNNEQARHELGLASDFITEDDARLFDVLVDEMWGYHKPAPLTMRKVASTSVPMFTNDPIYKHQLVRRVFDNIDDYLRAQLTDHRRALVEYDSAIVAAINGRMQPDKITLEGGVAKSKERLVPDEEYVRSGGAHGHRLPADKTVLINGRVRRLHAAMRWRAVYAMSFAPNMVLSAMDSCSRAVALERFAFTWSHHGSADIEQKVQRFKTFMGFDVTNMDALVPAFVIRRFHQRMHNHWDARVCQLTDHMFRAPFVVPNPWHDKRPGYSPFFGGVPMAEEAFTLDVGLPSGIAINPTFGKAFMVWVYLMAARDCGVDISDLEAVLTGKHPTFGILNMGDDAVMLMNSEELAARLEKYTSPYMKIEPENPAQFLGHVFLREEGSIKVRPNILTYPINWYAPEKGIDSPDRREFWALGFEARARYYSTAPAYKEVDAAIEATYRKAYGVSPRIMAQIHSTARLPRAGLTPQDMMVLQNPQYLHYRVSPDELSPAVLASLSMSVPPEDYYGKIQHLFKSRKP